MSAEGIPFPTREQIIEVLGFRNDPVVAAEIADALIEGHASGKILWDGENMVLVPETPNS